MKTKFKFLLAYKILILLIKNLYFALNIYFSTKYNFFQEGPSLLAEVNLNKTNFCFGYRLTQK